MMLKKIFFFVLIICFAHQLHAQNMRKLIKHRIAEAAVFGNFGVYDGDYKGVGVNAHYMLGIGRNRQRFKVGFGLRQYNFFAKNREYKTSDQDLVAELKNGGDSVYVNKVSSSLLSTYLALQFHIKRGIDFGVNFDLGGITFGGNKEGYFHSYELTLTERKKVGIRPSGFNTNSLLGRNGYGSTINEAYFQFSGGDIMRYRLGFNYFVNEINVNTPQTGNGIRFRTDNYMVMAAVVWNLRHNQKRYDMWNMNN
jgi:hypothetical protein